VLHIGNSLVRFQLVSVYWDRGSTVVKVLLQIGRSLVPSQLVSVDWDGSSTEVKVLCYKSEGRWFNASWCQWIGTAVIQWLRCSATNREVAGSIPAGVT